MATVTKTLVGDTYTDENFKALEDRINQVNDQLKSFNTTQATDDEIRSRAENEYKPIYNAQVAEQQAAKQSAQSVLDDNLGALQRQYGRDSEQLNRAYDSQAVNANNSMIARGFNNSSLAVALSNYVNTQRNRALNDLMAERTAAEKSARAAYNNAISAADANIGRLGSDLATNIDARYQALRDVEQNRMYQQLQAQNALELEKANLYMELEKLRRAAQNTYYSIHGSGGGSSSSSSSSSGSSQKNTVSSNAAKTQTPSSSLGDKFNESNKGRGAIGSAAGAVVQSTRNAISTVTDALSKLFSGMSGANNSTSQETQAPTKKMTSVNVKKGINYIRN